MLSKEKENKSSSSKVLSYCYTPMFLIFYPFCTEPPTVQRQEVQTTKSHLRFMVIGLDTCYELGFAYYYPGKYHRHTRSAQISRTSNT